MKNRFLLIAFTLTFSFSLCANEVISQKSVDEKICKQQYLEAVFKKHVAFSNDDNSAEVRRKAERSIDHSRKTLNESGSFCDALTHLLTEEDPAEDGVKAQIGERQ